MKRLILPVLAIALASLAACGSDTASSPTTAKAEPITIDVDADAGQPVKKSVLVGSDLVINVTSAKEQEFHLHGYDIEKSGTDVTFEFTADKAGDFELESHDTEQVLLELTVTA